MSGVASGLVLFASLTAIQQSTPSVDHVSILVEDVNSAVAALREVGFTVPPDTSVHTGQGTASRGVLLDNGYLEVIWITNPEELRAADPALAERMLSDQSHSPFALALFTPDPEDLPFITRSYYADWMAPGSEILLATTELHEPQVFVVPNYMSLAQQTRGGPPLTSVLPHANGTSRISNVEFVLQATPGSSSPLSYLQSRGVITLEVGQGPLVRIELDGARTGEVADLRPALPLVIRY